jgi:hypothetical protein
MSPAYSAMVRSLENLPEPATFRTALRRPRIRVCVQRRHAPVDIQVRPEICEVHVAIAVGDEPKNLHYSLATNQPPGTRASAAFGPHVSGS